MIPDEFGSFAGFVTYMRARRRREWRCPVCGGGFRPEDRVYDFSDVKGLQAVIHAECVTVREERGQMVMSRREGRTSATLAASPWPMWTMGILAALLLLALLVR